MRHGIEDYEFWLSILELGRSVYCLPEVLFLYRIKSVSRSTRFEGQRDAFIKTYEYIIRKHEKLYTPYLIDITLMLREENMRLEEKYSRLANMIPFYGLLKRLDTGKKQKIKRFLGLG